MKQKEGRIAGRAAYGSKNSMLSLTNIKIKSENYRHPGQ